MNNRKNINKKEKNTPPKYIIGNNFGMMLMEYYVDNLNELNDEIEELLLSDINHDLIVYEVIPKFKVNTERLIPILTL